VLLRLAYLAVSHAFYVVRLLPMSDREKDAEILVLRTVGAGAAAGRYPSGDG
jgi:hypothetical protein